MRPRNKKRILYFILGAMPTLKQYDEGEKLGAVFRNANHCGDGVNPEKCDQVIGAVPDSYKKLKGVEVLKSKIEDDEEEATTGGAAPTGNKPWEAGAPKTVSFEDAVNLLEAENDDHWTQDGSPDCNALAAVGCEISAEARDHAWAELSE